MCTKEEILANIAQKPSSTLKQQQINTRTALEQQTLYQILIFKHKTLLFIIKYLVRKCKLLRHNLDQTIIFLTICNSSIRVFCYILPMYVRKVSRCLLLTRLPSTKHVTTNFSSSSFRNTCPGKFNCRLTISPCEGLFSPHTTVNFIIGVFP